MKSPLAHWFIRIAAVVCVLSSAIGATLMEKRHIVESKHPGNSWRETKERDVFAVDDFVRTGIESRAAVGWESAAIIKMASETKIRIPPGAPRPGEPLTPGTSLLDIRNGEVYAHFSAEAGAGKIFAGEADVRHQKTELLVRVSPGGVATVTVLSGEVELRNSKGIGEMIPLTAGEAGVVAPGKAAKKTAVIEARNHLIDWCLYYPGVVNLPELRIPKGSRLAATAVAYAEGNPLTALSALPKNRAGLSGDERALLAATLLAVGEVDNAETILRGMPESSARRALEQIIATVCGEPLAGRNPASASEWLAESYALQSRGGDEMLQRALKAARKAAQIDPKFGYAWVRIAELEFSFGRTREALRALGQGEQLAPNNAQAHSLRGFLLAAENRTSAALRAFDEAIALDSGLGNARLGRGLCLIRSGKIAEGVADVKAAAVLEPNRSFLRSYLGKAFDEAGLPEFARRELKRATEIDPRDPTPLLYSALVSENENRFNRAVSELQQSLDLNDNRRLYRSEFLLDQDRAVRSANLARIYQRAGLNEVAVREATRAVESDYGSASAHLFLANSFDALRDPTRIQLRYETAWFNELLLANLLSPVGGGSLSQFVSQQEYSKLFEADGAHFSSDTEWRSDGIIRENASIFGTFGNLSFALDGLYYSDNGTRPNNQLSLAEVYATFKYQFSPDDTFFFLGKWADQEQGDLFQTYDHAPLEPFVDFEEKQEPGLLLAGWNHRWSPGSNTLFLAGRLSAEQLLTSPAASQSLVVRDALSLVPGFITRDPLLPDQFSNPALANAKVPPVQVGVDGASLVFSPDFLKGIAPFIGKGAPLSLGGGVFDFYTLRQFELRTVELQHIWQTKRNTAILGARWVEGEFETDTLLTIPRPTTSGGFATPAARQHVEVPMRRQSLYAYDFLQPAPWLTLLGGVSWDRIEHPENFRNPPVNDRQSEVERVSGKAGFTLALAPLLTVRGVYAESLGGVTFDESVRLEPVQLAGFNQAFRTVISESLAGSVETPLYKNYGISVEGRIPRTKTWWGAAFNVVEEDVDRTVGAFDGYDSGLFPSTPAFFPSGYKQQLAYREETFSASVHQLIGEELSISASYEHTHAQLRTTVPEFLTLNPAFDQQGEGVLHHALFAANWNSPSGWFARAEAHWYSQELDGADFQRGLPNRPGDDFWQFNAFAGYRFARNRCEITAGVLNLTDTDYQLDPITYQDTLPRERTAVLRCKFTF